MRQLIHSEPESQATAMPGRESFHVGTNKYLKNANFSLCLGEDVYVAAFREKLVAGVTEVDAEGDLRFSKKAIVIPSNVYYQFVDQLLPLFLVRHQRLR